MDDTVLGSLRSALRATPDNRDLALVVLRAALDRGEPDLMRSVLSDLKLDPTKLGESDRRDFARAYLSVEQPARALEWLAGTDSETLLLRARAHCRAGDLDAGRADYQKAVAANPALEDRALEA